MNILDENGESYFVTAFDHSTQEQGTATSKDAFTGGDINASLTQEVVELRKEVIGHGTDQLLYLAGKDGGLVSDDLVDIAVFQDPGITYNPQYREGINKDRLSALRAQYPEIYDEFVDQTELRIFKVVKTAIA